MEMMLLIVEDHVKETLQKGAINSTSSIRCTLIILKVKQLTTFTVLSLLTIHSKEAPIQKGSAALLEH